MDLRRHQRIPVHYRSFLSSLSLGDNVGRALDLSLRGRKIQSDMRVVPRMNLVVHLDIPGQDSLIEVKQAGFAGSGEVRSASNSSMCIPTPRNASSK